MNAEKTRGSRVEKMKAWFLPGLSGSQKAATVAVTVARGHNFVRRRRIRLPPSHEAMAGRLAENSYTALGTGHAERRGYFRPPGTSAS
jgi:hypothetical protein